MKIKSKSLLHILFISLAVIAVVFVGLPANAAAADYNVKADSPVSEVVQGKNVTFDWHLRTDVTQARVELYTSAGSRLVNPSNTQYTWTDYPYDYGWWYVIVYKEGQKNKYGQTSPKHFYLSPTEPKKPKYLPEYDSKGRILFFEVDHDYTITLSDYFWNSEKLPDRDENERGFYLIWAANHLPDCDWDFIRLEDGTLTIKQGYRWDGASYPCKNLGSASCIDATFDIRASLVHDALYDLMRMDYLASDRYVERPDGKYNRKMADMLLYMIGMEDGHPKTYYSAPPPLRNAGAESDYNSMRIFGAGATHDTARLDGWKYHVSELTANASDGKVELEWKPADNAGKAPNYVFHYGYLIYRNGTQIKTVLHNATSYVDNNAKDGKTYTYQIKPQSGSWNPYDYSNTVQVTVYNVAPTVDAGPDDTINEGNTFTSSGSFTDPSADDPWTATVDYGDGSGPQPLTLVEKAFTLEHTYGDNDVYTVNVTVTDNDGGVGSDTAQVTVNNVAPTVNVVPIQSIPGEDTLTNSGSFTDPGADTWTATVDYGEGSGDQSLTLTGKTFSLSHVYADNGVYTVRVTVTDDDGGVGTDTLTTVVVTNVPYNPYDKNKDCVIDIGEVNAVIDDYRTQGPTSIADVNELIDMYRSDEPYC
ncbi:MAG: PKD domain-containing protein [Methanococcoides sp.]|nr:PKD domain-containing protein [Methanococcoides sp.]